MRWPDSWYVEEEVPAPSAYWAEKVRSLGDFAKHVKWTRGVVAGPPWLRKLNGDNRPPLFPDKED
jgi:hypothetical protein